MSENECLMCPSPAQYIRHTQFAGSHPFCKVHAEQESDFGKNDSCTDWESLSALAPDNMFAHGAPEDIAAMPDGEHQAVLRTGGEIDAERLERKSDGWTWRGIPDRRISDERVAALGFHLNSYGGMPTADELHNLLCEVQASRAGMDSLVNRLCSTPLIEDLAVSASDWESCETVGDVYDMTKRKIRAAFEIIRKGDHANG